MRLKLPFQPIILIIIIATVGFLYLVFKGTLENIVALLTGFFLGLIPKFLPHSIEDKIKNNDKIRRVFRLSDHLRGKPVCEGNGIRYYNFQTQLPNFDSILGLEGLTKIEILNLSSNTLLSNFKDEIEKSLNDGVKFYFLLLKPKSQYTQIQSQNFSEGGLDLEQQIEKSLLLLSKIKTNLRNDLKNNLIIKLYDEQIGAGVMIVHTDKDSWIKANIYVIGSYGNLRPSQVGYLKDNEKFYNENHKRFNKLWDSPKTVEYNV